MKRGYTLLEICVVLLIIGIALMVVAPRLIPVLTGTRLDTSARQLATFCRYLNAQAVLAKVHHRLNIDIDMDEYWVTALLATTEEDGFFQQSQEMEEVEVTNDLLTRKKLPEGVHFEDVDLSFTGGTNRGTVEMDFTPIGPTERMLVHLVSDDGSQLTVFFDYLTGTTGVLEGYATHLDQQTLGWKTGAQRGTSGTGMKRL